MSCIRKKNWEHARCVWLMFGICWAYKMYKSKYRIQKVDVFDEFSEISLNLGSGSEDSQLSYVRYTIYILHIRSMLHRQPLHTTPYRSNNVNFINRPNTVRVGMNNLNDSWLFGIFGFFFIFTVLTVLLVVWWWLSSRQFQTFVCYRLWKWVNASEWRFMNSFNNLTTAIYN